MNDIPTFDEITNSYLVLIANRALLCEIRSNMRRVSVEYIREEEKIKLYFYYSSSPPQADLDYDVEGTIIAEMSAYFPESISFEEISVILPNFEEIPQLGINVFQMHESSISCLKLKIDEISLINEINKPYLIICANNALLGKISPEIRRIYLKYSKEESKISLYFFYDCEFILNTFKNNEGSMIEQLRQYFPMEIIFESESVTLLYPKSIPDSGICVFARYERYI